MALLDEERIADVRHVTGGDVARAEIGPWLNAIMNGSENEEPLTVTLFRQAPKGSRDLTEERLEFGEDVVEFTDMLVGFAEDDCLRSRGKANYVIRIRGKRAIKRFQLHRPLLSEDEDPELNDELDYSPNMEGMYSQQMHHTQKMMQGFLQMSKELRTSLQEENQELRQEVREHRREEHELRRATKDIYDMQFARDMALRKHEESEKLKEKVIGEVATFGKRYLSAKLGIPLEPPQLAAGSADEPPLQALMIEAIQSLTEEQIRNGTDRQRQLFSILGERLARWHMAELAKEQERQQQQQDSSAQKAEAAPSAEKSGNGKGSA
jgi:hypothetical protein